MLDCGALVLLVGGAGELAGWQQHVCAWVQPRTGWRGTCDTCSRAHALAFRSPGAPSALPSIATPSQHHKHTGFAAAGYVALTGDLPGAMAAFKANLPVLAYPAKFIVSFPLVYHYLGGMRHFVWDLAKIGNQADKTSLLETPTVEESSKYLAAASLGLSLVLTVI